MKPSGFLPHMHSVKVITPCKTHELFECICCNTQPGTAGISSDAHESLLLTSVRLLAQGMILQPCSGEALLAVSYFKVFTQPNLSTRIHGAVPGLWSSPSLVMGRCCKCGQAAALCPLCYRALLAHPMAHHLQCRAHFLAPSVRHGVGQGLCRAQHRKV